MRIIPIPEPEEPTLSPDLVFDGIMADLALAGADETGNRGGLAAREVLKTAVIIALLTDARAEPEELRDGDVNRGWPGDRFDLDASSGEAPIGSKLWLLMRSTVDDVDTPRRAETYAIEALQPLIDQGAAASVTAAATADPARNRLELAIEVTDRAGQLVVATQFRILWSDL